MRFTGIYAEKINSKTGDGHRDGDKCIIIGESKISVTKDNEKVKLYICSFGNNVTLPVIVASNRIKINDDIKAINYTLAGVFKEYIEKTIIPTRMFNLYLEYAPK